MPSRDINLTGIIIKKTKYRETSLIADVITPQYGHISLMAKGVRNSKSKSIGLLETLNELDLILYKNPSSEWYIFKNAELITPHLYNTDFETGILMQAAAEIYKQLIMEKSDYQELYELLQNYLQYIRSIKKNGIAVFWRFLLKLFQVSGIELDVLNCLQCQKNQEFVGYYPQKHGFICRQCYRPVQDNFVIKINSKSAFIISNLKQIGNMLTELEIDKETRQRMNSIFLMHLSEHFHKAFHLRSLEMIN